MPPVQLALYAVLGTALAVSVVTDLKSRLIYNVVTLPTLVIALVLRGVLVGWRGSAATAQFGLMNGLVAMAIGFVAFYVMFWLGGMGGGDVKLMAAVGAALGIPVVLYALMFTALVGGLMAILVLLWEGSFVRTFANMGRKVAHVLHIKRVDGEELPKKYVPYGVAIALGCVWAVAWDWTHPILQDSIAR